MQLIKRAAAAVSIGFIGVLLARQLDVVPTTPHLPQQPLIPDGSYLPDERNNIEVFQRAAPSVVHVSSVAIQRDFFSFDTYEIPQGTGTGFVWDRQGHIVTNLHVIQQADRVFVRTIDQKDYPARLVGADPHKDIANSLHSIPLITTVLFWLVKKPSPSAILLGSTTP
jgi:S1-C subfamily serine protease